MEYIGFILSFTDYDKCYYSDQGNTDNPFEANFYINEDEAIRMQEIIKGFHKQNVEPIKVKKTISIIE